jgi:hypothetical protein
VSSPADVTEYVEVNRQAFPDLRCTVDDGRITEIWSQWDTLGMARELEFLPPLFDVE